MDIKLKLIHKEWNDYININKITNRLYRINIENEYANFKIDKNFLFIEWDKWEDEIFVTYDNNIYYHCILSEFIHKDWEDICYIDYFNNILYKKKNFQKGIFKKDKNNIIIDWENFNDDDRDDTLNYDIDDILKNKDDNVNHIDNHIDNNHIDNHIDNNNHFINDHIVNDDSIIPNIIYFIYGLKKQTEEFELYRYIAIKSAYEVNKPEKIILYYHYEPYGYWWDKIKTLIILEKIDLPTEIFGNKIYHYAHQADIIRLEKLIQHGGIYLDIDTICLKSFKDLLHHDFIMGTQINSDNSNIYGLCNAVILSKPQSEFALKWYHSYKNFRSTGRDEYWDEHSVLKPLELSKKYPELIKILDSNSFFYPLWYTIENILFNNNYDIQEYKKIISNNYCIHLWDTYSHSYLKTIDENNIYTNNTLYNIFSRKFLNNKISILFLTYNRFDITQKCLNSYLKCLDRDDIEEIIILDNNSNKDIIDFLNNFKNKHEKIKIIYSNENLGVCHGRIILMNEAKGDIIISLDSDAYLINNLFFDKVKDLLYDEKYGIVGISGAYIRSWEFGKQEDIPDDDNNEYIVDHIAGCCQAFRKDLFHFGFKLDPYYTKFWVEDTDLSMQSLYLNKINYRIPQYNYIEHHWGGSGKDFQDLFLSNWNYFSAKWKNLNILKI